MRPPMIFALFACRKATAAAEMALVTPLLIILMFGSFELGNYFLSEHVVVKAVRDGARYAGRQSFTTMPCGGVATNETQIKNLVRTGSLAGTSPRLSGWTNNATITVAITCEPTASGYSGIYKGMTDVPIVTVSASVPYSSLFNELGFSSSSLLLDAESQSAVMGL
ncbi:MAG: pilus assembly protein [Alphaproteobacteria bacterium]|nr:pilus assembly protein [Alphaproteobacteria bacterium]